MSRWDEASEKLDAFIELYKDKSKTYLDLAYLDRANCYYARDEYEKALGMVQKIRDEFPSSQVTDAALMLEGDVRFFLEEYPRANEAYNAAKEIAEGLGHDDIVANALSQLVAVAMAEEKGDAAVAFYDAFMERFEGSFYEPITLVTAMPALAEAGRTDEALNKLEKLILELGKDPTSEALEKAVNTFTHYYSELKDPVSLFDRLREIQKQVIDNDPLRAWLMIAQIDTLERPENVDKFERRSALINVLYRELGDIDKAELANYIKFKLGRQLVQNGQLEAARPWFQHISDGVSADFKPHALLGLAQANAAVTKTRDEGIANFKRIIVDFDNEPELQEEAHLGLGRAYFDKNEYRKAIDEGFLPYVNQK